MKKPLKEGSEYCYECNGEGRIITFHNNYKSMSGFTCPVCHGDGQFDWIEQVVGKESRTQSLGFFPDDIGLGYHCDPDNKYLEDNNEKT